MGSQGSALVGVHPCILIVEDEGLIRFDTVQAFERAGWRAFEAASGEAALTMIKDHRPSVIFTDINLGGLVSGWDVGSVGCAHGATIFYTSGEARAQALMPPSGMFFLKPYETLAVIRSCSAALGS